MTELLQRNKLADRKNNKIRKREDKKRQIAASAINALKVYGYAQTTLRDVAAQSDMPLSSLHYYFEDKDSLLIYCVRQYKAGFIETVNEAVKGLDQLEDIKQAFCRTLAQTIADDAELHRLWYDIRNQATFEETFVPVVEEIENQLIGLMTPFAKDRHEQKLVYVRFDGAFRYMLQQHLTQGRLSVDEMSEFFHAATE